MSSPAAARPGNLPAEPNSFVGRERDLSELSLLLAGVRALTLCGPGGIGKTRLALRLAHTVGPEYPDGSWLVELADTTDPGLVGRAIAAVLGVREEPDRPLPDTLTEALLGRRMLLILDTCEHVVDACAGLVQRLVARCAGVRTVVTSREPLRVPGETVWRVPPLELPPAQDAGGWQATEAVRLFAERAAASRAGFALHAGNAGAVARLCRMLDGMPLAIELAAARVRALSVEQIADRLGDQFQLLASSDPTAPPRQQTLRAAVDWSYALLTGPEQLLLRRVSVFSGWNLDMAEQVCADDDLPAGDILGLLASLISKSLVTLDTELGGTARYRLLDTIRQYAARLLTASGEERGLQRRHRDCLLALVESVVAQAFVRGDPPWPQRVLLYWRVLAERANLAAALAVCLARRDIAEGLRMCIGLRNPWVANGDVTEGTRWFDQFLAHAADVPPAIGGRALVLRGELAFEQQDYATAQRCARAGLVICQELDDPHQAVALRVLALNRMRSGDVTAALDYISQSIAAAHAAGSDWEEGLALAVQGAIIARQGRLREAQESYASALEVLRDNNGWGTAQTLYGLGGIAVARGDHDAALRHFRAALALYEEIDARPEVARCLAGIGRVALATNDLGLAASSLSQSLRLSVATGQRLPIARCLEACAVLALRQGDPARAVKVAAAALTLRASADPSFLAQSGHRINELLEMARRHLGAATAAELAAEGRAMTADEAVALALAAGPAEVAQPPAPTGQPANLTSREWEIAVLIERGLTNRQIAGELVISPTTAARHVANILRKLGFSSRVQIAAWAAAQRPDGHR